MERKGWKLVAMAVFVGAMVAIVTYAAKAEKDKKMQLPAAVKAALSRLYPQAQIDEAELEDEGVKVYEVELELGSEELELMMTPDGMLVEVETEISMDALPPAVAKAITEAAQGAKIEEVSKEVTYAVVKLVKLDKPQTSYEAELTKDGAECEIEVAADGKVLEQSKWKKDEEPDHDDDDDDDDD
jgi:hypothetical protein